MFFIHRVNAVSDSVDSEMYSILPPTFPHFLTSLLQLSSGRFTCFQFEPPDSQPGWQVMCQLISSSLEFFHYSLIQSLMCVEKYGREERCRAQLRIPDGLGSQHFQLGVIARLCRARLMATLWISVPTRLEGERQRVGPSLHP